VNQSYDPAAKLAEWIRAEFGDDVPDPEAFGDPHAPAEREALVAALLAEIPVICRAPGPDRQADQAAVLARMLAAIPDDTAATITSWLRAAREEGRRER